MGGGLMLPELTAGGRVFSRVPFKPFSSAHSAGLAEACISTENSDCLCGIEETRNSKFDCNLGPVPSQPEVQKAMVGLRRLIHRQTDLGSDHLQSFVPPRDSRMLQSPGYGRVHDAMSMLENDPSMQNMVVSISCDKAVWEAILNNRTVQNLCGSLAAAKEENIRQSSNEEEADIVELILKWMLGFTKTKVLELIEKFGLILTQIFQSADKEKPTSELTDLVEEKIRSSLLLSVVILLIVVVTRNE